MAKLYYENDANPSLVRSRKVAVIGYGSQGRCNSSRRSRAMRTR